MKDDPFGDRIKQYEMRETSRAFLPYVPVYARIDGRSFSRFTKGMDRPFDTTMADVMQETTRLLVEKTCAKIAYSQSDEISLVWVTSDPQEEMLFAGKVQKLCSILAGMASSIFVTECIKAGGDIAARAMSAPHFDARVFQLPNRTEAVNCFVWREKDATKNAVSMAARTFYSHKALQGKKSGQMQEMIFQKGQNFNDYPVRFRRGVYLQTRSVTIEIPEEQRMNIPEKHRPDEGTLVQRSVTGVVDMPILSTVVNREAVIFDGAVPVVASDA